MEAKKEEMKAVLHAAGIFLAFLGGDPWALWFGNYTSV